MKYHLAGAIGLVWLLTASPAPAQTSSAKLPAGHNVNSDAQLMMVFKTKVEGYLKQRKSLETPTNAPLKKTSDDPNELLLAERNLAAKVRMARANAKRGDFFTPATEAEFRRLLSPPLKGSDGPENKNAIKDDAPEPKDMPFKVNAEYPKGETWSTVPPDVLATLPVLPEGIQYRFVGRHLLLYDSKPNIILDFMLNALPVEIKPVPR